MAREKVTSAEVALRAGVSRSAVSRVFTPGASASAKTVEKVRLAAEELGYRPNVLARAIVSGRSRMIGLVVAYLENQFYPEVLERLCAALQGKGYHVLVFMVSRTSGNVDAVVQQILDYQVDGIIAASVSLSSDLTERCQAAGVPVVLLNRSLDDPRISAVTSDNRAGGRRVAEFLLAGGHRNIGYIAGWEGASTQRDREAGFREGLAAAGQTLFAREIGNFRWDGARDAALQMFARDRPDAVFVANDHMAFAVIDALRGPLGLRVPDDVSVVGYDDVPAASWPGYRLTTVRQRSKLMVTETVDMLLALIESPDLPPRVSMIDGPLIVRGSARCPDDQTCGAAWSRTLSSDT